MGEQLRLREYRLNPHTMVKVRDAADAALWRYALVVEDAGDHVVVDFPPRSGDRSGLTRSIVERDRLELGWRYHPRVVRARRIGQTLLIAAAIGFVLFKVATAPATPSDGPDCAPTGFLGSSECQ
jgi:hypothetical protein